MVKSHPRNAELAALLALKDTISLKAMGCRFGRGLTGAVFVKVAGAAIGAWWYQSGQYNFARVAYQNPELSIGSIDEIVTMTRRLASSHFKHNHQLAM